MLSQGGRWFNRRRLLEGKRKIESKGNPQGTKSLGGSLVRRGTARSLSESMVGSGRGRGKYRGRCLVCGGVGYRSLSSALLASAAVAPTSAAVAPTLAALALLIGHSGDQKYRCQNYDDPNNDGPKNDCAHAGEQVVHELCSLKADGVAEQAANAAANSEGGARPIKRFPQAPFHPP